MNIREALERLRELAGDLPDGLDSELRIKICNGPDEPAYETTAIEIDTMWEISQDTREVRDGWVAVVGHPHKSRQELGPITQNVEDVVEQWSAELADGRSDAPTESPVPELKFWTDPDTDTLYALLALHGQRQLLRMELTREGRIRYPPGAPNAVEAGCICDPEKNRHGSGRQGGRDGSRQFIYKLDCPLHLRVDPPADAIDPPPIT